MNNDETVLKELLKALQKIRQVRDDEQARKIATDAMLYAMTTNMSASKIVMDIHTRTLAI